MFAGLDGCSNGWLVCLDKKPIRFLIVDDIDEFFHTFSDVERVFIDIPIGLPYSGVETRFCDKNTRNLLTRRRSSSVFPVPCRKAVYANTYEEANKINRMKINKGLSKQSWNISGKIKEVDIFLRENRDLINKLIESHPEICFWALNDGSPMKHYKKTKKGEEERIIVLRNYIANLDDILAKTKTDLPNNAYVMDDILDAAVLMIAARLCSISYIEKFSKDCEIDEDGLLMRIVYPPITSS